MTPPSELTDIHNALNTTLPTVTIQFAEHLYTKTTPLQNGRSTHAIAAATLYLAAKHTNASLSPDTLTNTDISRTYLLNLSKQIKRELNLNINLYNPDTYIETYATDLSLPTETTELAKTIAEQTTTTGLASGKPPTTVAAASTYHACLLKNTKRTQQEISDVSHTSPTTIRNLFQQQQNTLELHLTNTPNSQ